MTGYDEALELVREPENHFDAPAVRINNAAGEKTGCVFRELNADGRELSALAGAGGLCALMNREGLGLVHMLDVITDFLP